MRSAASPKCGELNRNSFTELAHFPRFERAAGLPKDKNKIHNS